MARVGFLKLVSSRASGVIREIPMRGTSVLGRTADCQVVVPDDGVTRKHAKIVEQGGSWSIEDLGGTNGTWLNGRRIARGTPLNPGDRVMVGTTEYEFTVIDEVDHRLAELEAAIAERPDDPGRWEVYADWLLERGDPLGPRIRGIDDNDDRWLEALAGLVRAGVITLRWEHGHVATAHVHGSRLHARLGPLLGLRVCRFLRELRLDLASSLRDQADRLEEVLAHVASSLSQHALPALRTLRFEPLHDPAVAGVRVRLPAGSPYLADDPANGMICSLKSCWLEENGARTVLVAGARHPLGGLAQLRRHYHWLLTPTGGPISVTTRGQTYELGPAENGFAFTHLLQPGDRVHVRNRELLFGGE